MNCNTLGCNKEATKHSSVDIGGGLKVDIWSCDEHHDESVRAVLDNK